MTLSELVGICRKYSDLGQVMQDQLLVVVEDRMTLDNVNDKALEYIDEWLIAVREVVNDDEIEEEIEMAQQAIDDFRDGVEQKLDDEWEASGGDEEDDRW